jgi:hypothetical protein
VATGHYEKYYPLQGVLVAYKVGQSVGEKIEVSGGTLLGVGLALLYFLFHLFYFGSIADVLGEELFLFLLVLAIIFIIVGAILLSQGQ